MALDSTAAKALAAARALGAGFGNVAMLGRQWFTAEPSVLGEISNATGVRRSSLEAASQSKYAEPFFEAMGADVVHSFDVSTFENATHVHDFNLPIPDTLRGRYSLVFDGGTMEHIFNAPQALKNCMEMLSVGGFFVQVTNGNNFMGHGFWQFSPELLYRVFSPQNGFHCFGVFAQELRAVGYGVHAGRMYLARDPATLGWRVELHNTCPTYLITIARRDRDVPVFASYPQQSDYQALWSGTDVQQPRDRIPSIVLKSIRRIVPPGIERLLRHPLRNKAYYPLSDEKFISGQLEPI